MSNQGSSFQRLVVVAHPQIPEALEEAARMAAFLQAQGLNVQHGSLYDEILRAKVSEREFDLLIALGGDGTVLRTGHLCGPADIPILGINLGHFGFLMEIKQEEWQAAILRLLSGDFWVEKHMMLEAQHWRESQLLNTWNVVNEVCVSRGQSVRPIHLNTYVDGRFLTTYVADALIASTPTGSTAYALAAGGPILPPELRTILLIAVAPHLTLDRAIVLAEGATVRMEVPKSQQQAVLSVDGQAPESIENGDRVEVYASEHSLKFIRFQDPGYFYRNLTSYMNYNPSTGNHR